MRDGVERAEAKAQSGERGRSSTPGKEDDGGPNAWREPEDPECLETRESRKSLRLGKAARECEFLENSLILNWDFGSFWS